MVKTVHRLGPGMTAVVTGGAGGLGRALGRALESRGLKVVLTDAPGVTGVDRTLDVTDAAAARALAAELSPQVWVNNAGVLGTADGLTQSDEEVARVVDVNLSGVINGTRAAAAVMAADGGGVVLNIGSLSAWNPTPGLAVYAATKHAVRAYSAAMAAELADRGVRVVCLCPDGIWTPMLQAEVSTGSAAMPFSGRRLFEPDEVAEAAVRLLEGKRLLHSMPQGRATLAKVSGLWPSVGLATRAMSVKAGRRGQRRYRERLEREGGR